MSLAHELSFKTNIFGKFYSNLIVVVVMEEVLWSEKLEEYVPPFLAVPSPKHVKLCQRPRRVLQEHLVIQEKLLQCFDLDTLPPT